MQVCRLTRNCEDFYARMGPVFGSRAIERAARDRFYDDPGKVWFLIPGQGAASVLGRSIRNFWAASGEAAAALLGAMLGEYAWLDGVVPKTHGEVFEKMGFAAAPYRKNFLEVFYEKD